MNIAKESAFRIFWPTGRIEIAPLTRTLIFVATVVSLLTSFAHDYDALSYFSLTRLTHGDSTLSWARSLPELMNGQVWRLVTPVFPHTGVLHLLSNCFWLAILGTMVERRLGARTLALLFVEFAAVLNLALYFTRGPNAAGSSHVLAALFGYIWIRGELDVASGLRLHGLLVLVSLAGLVLEPLVTSIPGAVFPHVTGLAFGMIVGLMAALVARTSPNAAVPEPAWNLKGILTDIRIPLNRLSAALLTVTLTGVTTIWGLHEAHGRAAVTGERVYYWAQLHIGQKAVTTAPYHFARLGSDARTGWELVSSNRWRLRGLITLQSGQSVEWRADVQKPGAIPEMTFLEIGRQLIISNGTPTLPESR